MAIFRLLPKGLFIALLLWSASFNMPGWTEAGSSQAVMVLFVPSTDSNLLSASSDSSSSSPPSVTPNYKRDISTSFIQQSSSGTYRIWMTL